MLSRTHQKLAATALGLVACAGEAADDSAARDDAPVRAQAVDVVPNLGASGGASTVAIFYDDPDLRCYKLRSFASAANKNQKYTVPTSPDPHVTFTLRAPWTGAQYIKSFRNLIDDASVVQHVLLFRQLNGGSEGVQPRALGVHPDGELLHGWAPGADDLWLDRDVGVEVPAGALLQLEAHYDNRTGAPVLDASGVEVCVTPRKPAHLASLSRLGTDAISGPTARGTCTYASGAPVRVITAQPRMHRKGAHMRVEVQRADGTTELVHDQPFAFDQQRAFLPDLTIQPGDRITTTCDYRAPSRFGMGSSDEHCYLLTHHWPRGTLVRRSLSAIIHGPSTCID